MNTMTERPTDFVAGQVYPTPVTHVIGFGYYDGVTDGVLKTRDGSVYRFDMTDEELNPAWLDHRAFRLAPLPAAVFDDIVSLLSPFDVARWPCWVPVWTFPSEDVRRSVDEQIECWLAASGPPAWIVESNDLLDVVTAVPVA